MNNRLVYEKYKGCKDIITINLNNDYTIVAIKSWNSNDQNYSVDLYIKGNGIDKLDLIEKAESMVFNSDYKSINKDILKYVSTLLSQNFFTYYIDRYEYELKCFDIGNDQLETERLCTENVD